MNWLLLRGLSREKRHWGNFSNLLAESSVGGRVIGLDLPGAGSEHLRASPDSISGIAEDLRQRWLRIREDQPGPWGVIAISMGGMIAMDWCSRFPHDFSAAVLINSSAANLGRPLERVRPRALFTAISLLGQPDLQRRELGILKLTTRLRETEVESISKRWASFAVEYPVSAATAFTQIMAASKFNAPSTLSVPLLVISGAGDLFTAPVCSDRLAKKYNAKHVVHPSAGHDLPLDAPEWMVSQISNWLESLTFRADSAANHSFLSISR
ncbi:MAG: alpha/beta fold hydrolase [Oligoflexia bacterium]